MDVSKLLEGYDLENLTIASLGGHSACEVSLGAKKQGIKTCVVAKKGREKTYTQFLKTDEDKSVGCVDEVILVDEFSDILKPQIQKQLRAMNALFIHSRYFWVYFDDFAKVENEFEIPILGSRKLLRLEERDEKPNQYDVLKEAEIRIPKIFEKPEDIDRLTLTKIPNATRSYERENFLASSEEEWKATIDEKLEKGEINKEGVEKAVIEEFILGAQINFNFFYSPLSKRLELLGCDTRRQTNLDGWLRLPANQQLELAKKGMQPLHIETGHIATTVKESLLEKAYEAGVKFVESSKKFDKEGKGITGPFALQGSIDTNGKSEELVVFDVSFRIPGSPGISATPYSGYLFGRSVSMGERIAMEVNAGRMSGRLEEILS
jgi:5-formaminoimidazole-4-carboxamide-1-(beta)-D-ribofuranosyl 5'-monophosphate synthetase